MRLGSSLRRRRERGGAPFSLREFFRRIPRGDGGSKGERWRFLRDPATLGLLAVLAVVGFVGGYIVSTRVLYPLPPPPGDLWPVPDLRGRSMAEVTDTLAALGLVLGPVDSLNHPAIPDGRTVGQSPLPGQLSAAGDTVRIALSTGPEERPVPDVLRLSGDWARTILETAGFVVVVDSVPSDDPRGLVVTMSPEPGTEATIPIEVRLRLSLGPPEFDMPLLVGLPEEEARVVLDSLGLVVGEVETRFRFGRDQGMVVEQDPPAGTRVQEGSPVRLVVGRRGGSSGGAGPRNKPTPPP